MTKLPKIVQPENFEKFTNWEIPKIVNSENSEYLKIRKFKKFKI